MKISEKKKKIFLYLLPLCLIAFFLCFQMQNRPPETVERRFPAMNTLFTFKLTGEKGVSAEQLSAAADAVQETVAHIENTCNIFDPESELSRLNKTACRGPVKCSPLLWELLCEAQKMYVYSEGAFDVTVKPLMKLWGFHGKKAQLPSPEKIAELKTQCGMDKILFDSGNHTVFFRNDKIGIDLGGIAKGFALDQSVKALKKHGVRRGVLNFGGNISCLELPPSEDRTAYRIAVRDPYGKFRAGKTVQMLNNSIATSGNYERYVTINGKRYTHIIDPKTGFPVSGMLSVSVITPRGVDSDALSTAIFVRGEKFAEKVCKDLPSTSVIIYREENGKSVELLFGPICACAEGKLKSQK